MGWWQHALDKELVLARLDGSKHEAFCISFPELRVPRLNKTSVTQLQAGLVEARQLTGDYQNSWSELAARSG